MTTITSIAVNSELLTFQNDPTSDSQCGLARMLAWVWPMQPVFDPSLPYWPVTASEETNSTAVAIAGMAVKSSIPNSATAPSTADGLTTLILDTASLFSFAMMFNQIAMSQGVSCVSTDDAIVALCVGAVAAASSLGVATSLQGFLAGKGDAVSGFIAASDTSAIPLASMLPGLIACMFTPSWTLSYYASFADGRKPDATFYDRRYAPLLIASSFDSWVTSLSVAASDPTLLDVSDSLATARATVVDSTEGPANMGSFFSSVQAASTSATDNINTLLATNAQFERRRSSISALSDNLDASNKRTRIALTELVLWIVTVVSCLVVAGVLIAQKNFKSVSVLMISTLALLTVDTIWRTVFSPSA